MGIESPDSPAQATVGGLLLNRDHGTSLRGLAIVKDLDQKITVHQRRGKHDVELVHSRPSQSRVY